MKPLVFLCFLFLVFSCSDYSNKKELKSISNRKSNSLNTESQKSKAFIGEKISGEALPQKTLDCFYPIDTIAKIYVYRDVVGGLEEQFHRVQSLISEKGNHIVVQVYSSDIRLLETLNYFYPSLEIYDHLVANRKKESARAEVFKNKMFPKTNKDSAVFVSRFPGHLDSTVIIKKIKRTVLENNEEELVILKTKIKILSYLDSISYIILNPFTNKQEPISAQQITKYGKGIGLVEWHLPNKKSYFRLEKIIEEKEWLQIKNIMQ
ncbi:MAG: hypothetical protein P8I93_02090 [Crocinitomicaceae bacterium]|nr:hypothetical protein [Crocinitomicaceae bacterium]